MTAAEQREALYIEFAPKVKGYVAGKLQNPQEAEDLVSEVFVKVYERLDSFDPKKASLSTWVYAITRNTVIDYYRTRRQGAQFPEVLVAEGDMEETLAHADALERLATALEALEERQRDIVILRYYRGMTLKDIAARMQISYAYVKVLHSGALNTLKKRLQ